jgi:hypothetical protein
MENNQLNILAVIGFNGAVMDSLILHPDNEHIIFPVGNQIVIRNVLTREQRFLKVLEYNSRVIIMKSQ